MRLMMFISDLIMPLAFVGIILYGYSKNIDIYETFIEGAKDGIMTVFQIFPTLVGLMVAVGILRESGALDFFCKYIGPFSKE